MRIKENRKKTIKIAVMAVLLVAVSFGAFQFGIWFGKDRQTMAPVKGESSERGEASSSQGTQPSRFTSSQSNSSLPENELEEPDVIRSAPTEQPYQQSSEVLLEVPYIRQDLEYPTGCEIVSATMLLRYYGYSTTVDEYIDDYLETEDFAMIDGVLYGGDPNRVFVGDPRSEDSYGCYAPVISYTMNNILDQRRVAVTLSGRSLQELCEDYISKGTPVAVWATVNMQPSFPSTEWVFWGTEEPFTWTSPEHCLVLVGYDEENYIFQDPYDNNGLVKHFKKLAETRYEELGRQAVVVIDVEDYDQVINGDYD